MPEPTSERKRVKVVYEDDGVTKTVRGPVLFETDKWIHVENEANGLVIELNKERTVARIERPRPGATA